MNWRKLTFLTGLAVAVVATPGAYAQDEPAAPVASSTTQMPAAPSAPSVSGERPSGHWRGGARGDWRNHGGDRHRHRWSSGHHHRWHRRHYYRPRFFYGSYPFGYPYGYGFGHRYGFGYPYGYPYYGASAALYYNGYRPSYRDRGVSRGGSVVVQVQQELARAGYYRGAIDGVIGNGTRSAIRAYERANGLPVDGRLDTQLLRTMGLS